MLPIAIETNILLSLYLKGGRYADLRRYELTQMSYAKGWHVILAFTTGLIVKSSVFEISRV